MCCCHWLSRQERSAIILSCVIQLRGFSVILCTIGQICLENGISRKSEKKLYRKLHVKQWKNKMPTYEPSYFDLRLHTPEEIAGAMCQAEVSHEVIVIFSFLPLFTVPAFGAFWVFLITSVLSALMDLLFAIMQRYNRPRILKLCRK